MEARERAERMIQDPHQLKAGDVIDGRFEILSHLGMGGFATVYKARQTNIDRDVAIKLMAIRGNRSPEDNNRFHERFKLEAKRAAQIDHPDIVTIHDYGVTEGGMPFIVMELLNGHPLDEEMEQVGAMEPSRALPLFVRCLDALQAAHDMGVVHKDLKPSNLFLTRPGSMVEALCVLDFGIAAMVDAEADARLTDTGQYVGTALYCAPEYYESQLVTPALDVYQMGLVLAEALMGTTVVQSSRPLQAIVAHCTDALELPSKLLSSPVGPIIAKAIAYKHEERYPNAGAFRDALAELDPRSIPMLAQAETTERVLVRTLTNSGLATTPGWSPSLSTAQTADVDRSSGAIASAETVDAVRGVPSTDPGVAHTTDPIQVHDGGARVSGANKVPTFVESDRVAVTAPPTPAPAPKSGINPMTAGVVTFVVVGAIGIAAAVLLQDDADADTSNDASASNDAAPSAGANTTGAAALAANTPNNGAGGAATPPQNATSDATSPGTTHTTAAGNATAAAGKAPATTPSQPDDAAKKAPAAPKARPVALALSIGPGPAAKGAEVVAEHKPQIATRAVRGKVALTLDPKDGPSPWTVVVSSGRYQPVHLRVTPDATVPVLAQVERGSPAKGSDVIEWSTPELVRAPAEGAPFPVVVKLQPPPRRGKRGGGKPKTDHGLVD